MKGIAGNYTVPVTSTSKMIDKFLNITGRTHQNAFASKSFDR